MKKKIVAFIPARGGSKGVKLKNTCIRKEALVSLVDQTAKK